MESISDNSINTLRTMRFLMGLFLAASLTIVEIGIAEIMISRDEVCRQNVSGGRIAIDPNKACSSEAVQHVLAAFSKGPFAATTAEVSSVVAWVITAGVYGLVGGILAQFASRRVIFFFLGGHILITISLTILSYLRTFIV
jgi:hypothetical protein